MMPPPATAGPAFAGIFSASGRMIRAFGARFAAGSQRDDSMARTGSRSRISSIQRSPWLSRSSGCTPTASTGSAQSSKYPARSSPRWSNDFSLATHHARRSGSAKVSRAAGLIRQSRLWRKLDASRNLVGAADLGIESCAGRAPAFLGHWIAGDQAEFGAIALRPLKIIEAGPVHVATDGRAGLDRPKHRRDVRQQKFRSQRIITVGNAIFSHIDRRLLAAQRH